MRNNGSGRGEKLLAFGFGKSGIASLYRRGRWQSEPATLSYQPVHHKAVSSRHFLYD
jgi:hypothetical protein